MLFCPVLAKLHPRRTLDSFPGLTPTPHSLSPNSFICHTSENSPLSPNIATLPKTGASNPCVCHTSEAPGGGSSRSRTPTHSPLLFSLFAQRVFHNSFALTPFHTLSKNSRGVPQLFQHWNATHSGRQPYSPSPIPFPFHETFFPAPSYLSPRTGTPPARRHPVMSDRNRGFFAKTALIAAAALLLSPLGALAQSTAAPASSNQSTPSVSKDRWLHVRVISSDAKGETVRVNVPLELAEKVLPAIHQERIHDGKLKIDNA